jgi:hypothetical protein
MAFVQATEFAITPAATSADTPGITTTSGNFLCAEITVGSGPGTLASVTDNYGNTWTAATGNPRAPNGQANVYVYWAHNITGGAGRATSNAVLVQTGFLETSSGTSHSSGSSGTLSESGCDMVCMAGDNAPAVTGSNITYTATSSGWTLADPGTVGTVASGHMTAIVMYRENVDTSAQTATWTSTSNAKRAAGVMIAVKSATAAPPAITDVDTDNSITATQTNVVITGTGFSTATVNLEQSTVVESQSIDSQNGTTIQFDVAQGDVKYGSATVRVTNADAQTDTQAVTLTAPTGKNFVNLTSVETVADNRLTATPDLEINDQVEWSNVQGGVIGDVTVNADGTYDCDEAVTAFDFRVWDHDDETWGSIATQNVGPPPEDETPDAFDFTDVTSVAQSAQQTSNTITVAGLGDGVGVAVTITGGTYSKNGAAYTSDAGTAVNGDTFAVRHTSSASYSTAVNTVLTIGTGSSTFTSTTLANSAPVFSGPTISNIQLAQNVAMTARDFSGRFTDADALTFTSVGTLPTGLTLSSAGVLSGTPTTLGTTSSLEIRASDGSLTVDSNSYSIEVVEVLPITDFPTRPFSFNWWTK